MVKSETAMFGAGCFWHVEKVFSELDGVISTKVGFSGGKDKYTEPSYLMVCTGITKHAEVVNIKFNPKKISYKELLEVFWDNHNPTTMNRQGFDVGTQYRSVIYYYNDKQKKEAIKSMKERQKKLDGEIVTLIEKAREFYLADEHHQKYLEKRSG